MSTAQRPRYAHIADDLRARVLSGELSAVGFPTEAALCDRYSVSRFTVREALRVLQDDGLIARRRGSGTTISPAAARGGTLHQPLSNVGEILQYARGSRIDYARSGVGLLPRRVAEKVEAGPPGGQWVRLTGVRRQPDGTALAVTEAFVHGSLAPFTERLDPDRYTLFRQLAELGGFTIGRVTQDIEAVAAPAQAASLLAVPRRSPCLRIMRGYYDTDGRLFELSSSLHPGDRFAYSMHIDVAG